MGTSALRRGLFSGVCRLPPSGTNRFRVALSSAVLLQCDCAPFALFANIPELMRLRSGEGNLKKSGIEVQADRGMEI